MEVLVLRFPIGRWSVGRWSVHLVGGRLVGGWWSVGRLTWSFDTKILSKNSYLNEGWLIIGRFKVRSLPRMINEEVLAQFIIKNPWKKWKFVTLAMYIEGRGWVKSKILLTNCEYIEKSRLAGIIYKQRKFGFKFAFSNCHLSPYLE